MALVLSWENPTTLSDQLCHTASVLRTTASGGGVADVDVPWGMYIDTETSDPKTSYVIAYLTADGAQQTTIENRFIRRWVLPQDACAVHFQLSRPDGSPDANRVIDISDDWAAGNYRIRIATNSNGEAQFVGRSGYRFHIWLEGDREVLDVCIPDIRQIEWADLQAYGSVVTRDHRAWY